ncbi:MAG: DHH family phosphoesterase [Lachnospiraceae bacterium]|nr:DHH family phosphoesterase [Lachnospiraceae bacterium]
MKLSDLSGFDEITIQCHDNPDPDALASAFGLYRYFISKGKKARIVYSGPFRIKKSNLLLMIEELSIPVTYIKPDDEENSKFPGLLITADCQYGQGNVTKLTADEIAVIDHHNGTCTLSYNEIHPELSGCSTLVWKLLLDEGFDVLSDRALCTALYYGLMTDTGNFSEISHPLDKDMRDTLIINESQIRMFSNNNISPEEMHITADALAGCSSIDEYNCAILKADECDPNILGIISDTALQVSGFDVVIAYGHVSGGFKLSVRSCIKEVMADEFVRNITDQTGSGGGHDFKAGGFISEDKLNNAFPGVSFEEYLKNEIRDYFSSFTIIEAKDYRPDMSLFSKYQKKKLPVGYVDPSSFLEKNTQILIRTLEGDTSLVVDGNFYLMVGILGEVYPMDITKFEKSYEKTDEPFKSKMEYVPKIYTEPEGEIFELSGRICSCMPKGTSYILAMELDRDVKVFTKWYEEKYMKGTKGDFLGRRIDDPTDFYVIRRDIFFMTYSPAGS